MAILVLVLFSAPRDALKKYFKRTAVLVGHIAEKAEQGETMFNGNHHEEGATEAPKKQPTPNKAEKPEATAVKPVAKDHPKGDTEKK